MENNRSYRIKTNIGDTETYKIDVPLTQTYDMFEILSLKLNQKNEYKYYDANYGVVVGRILANNALGLQNVKVSIFIPVDETESVSKRLLYNFASPQDSDDNGVRYNLLSDVVDTACHQDVGTFPNKRLLLDNNDIIEVFDKYYKYTTVTNEAGDYMLFGVPTGSHTLHIDVDLSDIGQLSQRPRDMIYKGYDANLFENPNKFKSSTNLNSLSQIITQDKGIYVYPYWGNSNNRDDSGNDHIAITRCDINVDYTFEPTCVFMGSIVTDKGSNAIAKNCTGTERNGKMSDLGTGEGTIEMIRKTIDGKVEEYQIKGNRLIDGDGVWCYQIPMNLDYVRTDEEGNIVPTDDPTNGIPTRARVRFRISLDETPDDATANKRAKFLVPNNPRINETDYPQFYETKEADYEFGSLTAEESYCDLFWNNVYSVKSYIPRLQKNTKASNRKHTGIKMVNHYGDNNPMPYNGLTIKLGFTYRLICVLTKILIEIIRQVNTIVGIIVTPFCEIAKLFHKLEKICKATLVLHPLGTTFGLLGDLFEKLVVSGIVLSNEFCDDGIHNYGYFPYSKWAKGLIGCFRTKTRNDWMKDRPESKILEIEDNNNELTTCIENNLAQENEATSFNFANDWINGVLYAPLWYRKITRKKKFFFGMFTKKAKDQWCNYDGNFGVKLYQPCSLTVQTQQGGISPLTGESVDYPYSLSNGNTNKDKFHEKISVQTVANGLIHTKTTMLGQTVYYYQSIGFNQHDNKENLILLFATDIVLLGNLNKNNNQGIPQFFKFLESTTYKLPSDILFTDTDIIPNEDGTFTVDNVQHTEATGCDWGNLNEYDECGKMGKDDYSGLFYSIGCSNITLHEKSCLNLTRICEFGVSLDESKEIPNLVDIENNDNAYIRLIPDGFISYDELYNIDERSMFATLNSNHLRTKYNNNGFNEYDFYYLYVDNFDGLLKPIMKQIRGKCNYINNYKLENLSKDYYLFRMGYSPYYYINDGNLKEMPRYENSFYFYFGLKTGKTAIDKFNSQYFAECESNSDNLPIIVNSQANSWCTNYTHNADGFIKIDLSRITSPYDIGLRSADNHQIAFNISDIIEPYIYIGLSNFHIIEDETGQSHWECNGDQLMDGKYMDLLCQYQNELSNIIETGIPNGNYNLVVTDADGNIYTTNIHLKQPLVSFEYYVIESDIDNETKISTYKDWHVFYNKKHNFDTEGGYVSIHRIVNGIDATGEYRIEINPILPSRDDYKEFLNFRKINNEWLTVPSTFQGSCEVTTNNNGIIINVQKETENIIFFDKSTYELKIGLPLGNVYYAITITELCNNEDRGNSSITNVYIQNTTPYKFYVNGVDVSLFKSDKFSLGWSKLGKGRTTGEGHFMNLFNVKDATTTLLTDDNAKYNVYGWLNLENEDNYDFSKNDNYYDNQKLKIEADNNISVLVDRNTTLQLDIIPDLQNEVNKLRKDVERYPNDEQLQNELYNAEQQLLEVEEELLNNKTEIDVYKTISSESQEMMDDIKNEYISSVKDTFWISCPTYSPMLDITVSVASKHLPIKYSFNYIPETQTTEYVGKMRINKFDNDGTYIIGEIDENLVDNIMIPTITSLQSDSYYFNGSDKQHSYSYILANSIDSNNIETKNKEYVLRNLTFGYDHINGKKSDGKYSDSINLFKRPYAIAVINANNDRLPTETYVNDLFDNEQYFIFHLIDKRLRSKITSWAAISEFPNLGYDSQTNVIDLPFFDFNGYMTGRIDNGILEEFSSQKINNKNIELTNSIRLNQITTTKYIKGYVNLQEEIIMNYVVDDYYFLIKDEQGNIDYDKTNKFNYTNNPIENYLTPVEYIIPLTPKNGVIKIQDYSCQLSNNIYGNMHISIKDCYYDRYSAKNGSNWVIIEFEVTNSDGIMGDMTTCIIANWHNPDATTQKSIYNTDDWKTKVTAKGLNSYPFAYFSQKYTDTDYYKDIHSPVYTMNFVTLQDGHNTLGFNVNKQGEMLPISILHPTLSTEDVKSYAYNRVYGENTTSEGDTPTFIKGQHYTTTNKMQVEINSGMDFYIIAMTTDNARAISSLYMFRYLKISSILSPLTIIAPNGDSYYEDNYLRLTCNIEENDDFSYYLRHFNYTATLTSLSPLFNDGSIVLSSNENFTASIQISANEHQFAFDIPVDVRLYTNEGSPWDKFTIGVNQLRDTELKIIDITGLVLGFNQHSPELKTGDKASLTINWVVNDSEVESGITSHIEYLLEDITTVCLPEMEEIILKQGYYWFGLWKVVRLNKADNVYEEWSRRSGDCIDRNRYPGPLLIMPIINKTEIKVFCNFMVDNINIIHWSDGTVLPKEGYFDTSNLTVMIDELPIVDNKNYVFEKWVIHGANDPNGKPIDIGELATTIIEGETDLILTLDDVRNISEITFDPIFKLKI